MNITLINNNKAEEVAVSDIIFGMDYASDVSKGILHNVVVAYRNGQRQGTKSQLNRGSLTRSNKKPWKQKGTGRARAGDAKSPIWTGGGVTFAQRGVRDYSQKTNKKVFRKSLAIALSRLCAESKLVVVNDADLHFDEPKTKNVIPLLDSIGVGSNDKLLGTRKILFIIPDALSSSKTDGYNNFKKSIRNMPNIKSIIQNSINPYSLLFGVEHVVITASALKQLEARYDINKTEGGV